MNNGRRQPVRNHISAPVLALTATLAVGPALLGQSPKQSTTAAPGTRSEGMTPDLSGVWVARQFPGTFTKEEPPMRPAAAEEYKTRLQHSKLEIDPDVTICAPPGPARILL